jgi:hypothetical protein
MQEFKRHYGFPSARVAGVFTLKTPPPTEQLELPVVELSRPGLRVCIKEDFTRCSYPNNWCVSIDALEPVAHVPLGLFDPEFAGDAQLLAGFPESQRFPSYSQNQNRFTCCLEEDWDVATLLRIASPGVEALSF